MFLVNTCHCEQDLHLESMVLEFSIKPSLGCTDDNILKNYILLTSIFVPVLILIRMASSIYILKN